MAKLYRRFESLSLRHAVCNAEKSGRAALNNAGNRRDFAILAAKPDWRKCPPQGRGQNFAAIFSGSHLSNPVS
jgi:hypothetical protein